MNPKMIVKTGVDIGMTVALMFLLFIIHHVLNCRWFGAFPKEKYTSFRIWQIVLSAYWGFVLA